MSGFSSACAAPACAIVIPAAPDNTFEEFLASPDRGGRFIVEIQAYPKSAAPLTYPSFPACGAPACSIGASEGTVLQPTIIALSDHAIFFEPDDDLKPNYVPDARLARRVDIQTIFSIVPNTRTAGQVLVGDIEVFNADGEIDQYIEDFAIDGRQVRLLFGPENAPYRQYREIERTFGRDWRGDASEIRLTVQDLQFKLDQPYQQSAYRGTGGIEGTSALTGVLKPRLIGERFNFEPRLIDPANYIYQISDSPIEAVVAIRDGGAEYADSGINVSTYAGLIGAAIAEGEYATALSLGLVRTRPAGGAPESVVTCHAQGDNTGGYSSQVGDLIVYEVLSRAFFDSTELDIGSFASFDAFRAGYYFSGSRSETFRDVLTELAGDTNGRIVADSKLRGIRIVDPDTASFSFTLQEEQIESLEPEGVIYAPIYQTAIRWKPNDRPLSDDEIVTPGDDSINKALLKLEYQEVSRLSGATALRHVGAQKLVTIETNLSDETSAIALLDEVSQLWAGERRIFKVTAVREAMFFTVGTVVQITHPRFGFSGGRNALIVERRNDYNSQKAEFRVLI